MKLDPGVYLDGETVYHVILPQSGKWYALKTELAAHGISGWTFVGQDAEINRQTQISDIEAHALLSPVITASKLMPKLSVMRGLVDMLNGTPYIPRGNSLLGTDCNGLVSVLANLASGWPAFSSRIEVPDMADGLAARGFVQGPGTLGDLSVGWCGACEGHPQHCSVVLPDCSTASSGEGAGVKWGSHETYLTHYPHWMHRPANGPVERALKGLK